MQKLLLTILIVSSFFIISKAQAATESNFILLAGEEKIVIDKNTTDSFYGYNQVPKDSLVTYHSQNIKIELANAFGSRQPYKDEVIYYHFKPEQIYEYVKNLATTLNASVTEPSLEISGKFAINFTPPKDGQRVNIYETTFNILNALENGKTEAVAVLDKTSPQKSLAKTNDLGIKELVAVGESNFAGSPNNRRHNIRVGIEKFKGAIIPQGAEFSFNDILGEVDGEHGFLPELVIKKTGTVPEFGGGLCQVSSTTFRAAMHAGLPITQRKNHAYAVQYYSPQGTDATIYPGVVDLKFINDTPGAILVWPYLKDKNNLVFEFYGTKDNRNVTLEKPIQWDRKPDGSMKASWTRIVEKDGQTSTSTFKSIYQPPALFHKTETFPTTTPASLQIPKTQ